MRLQWLMHPFLPEWQLVPDTPQAILLNLVVATAANVFPALAATSVRMSVVKLLGSVLPHQLCSVRLWGAAPSLARRIEFINLLGEWSSSTRNEVLLRGTKLLRRCARSL
jgi:hypothetical protein